MLVVRPVCLEDVDQLFDLIQLSELGLSSLKISKERLVTRVEESIAAFAIENAKPLGQPYVFVMEDSNEQKIVGTSSIYSKVGGFQPFYSYKIKTVIKTSEELGVSKEVKYLKLYTEHDGPTEIGSLFLSPDYWGSGNGRLLALSRFLFMADHLERFESETIAELRGVVRPDGFSPLWDALGAHFFQIEYPRADTLTLESKKFIAELMPKHPIYIDLLSQEAQDAIGEVHPKTRPARALLTQEGFEFQNFVDIFDGGPTVHCETENIRSIRESFIGTVHKSDDPVDGPIHLLANRKRDFRAVMVPIEPNTDNVTINQETAAALRLDSGDSIRAVLAKPATS